MFQLYFLNVRSFLCNYEVFINDTLIDCEYDDNNTTTEFSINHWLNKGINVISVKVSPLREMEYLSPRGRVEIEVVKLVEDQHGNNPAERVGIAELATLVDQEINRGNAPFFIGTKTFLIPDQFNLPWIEAPIFDPRTDFGKVFESYYLIHNLFSNKDIDSIIDLFKFKNSSASFSINERSEEFVDYVREGLMETWNDPKNTLWPLEQQQLLPRLFAGNKICSIYNELHQPVILYYNSELNQSTFIDIFLMKDANMQPVVIR